MPALQLLYLLGVRPRGHQNSSLALQVGLGQGLGPSSMDTGLLLLALPEVGCAPLGWGQRVFLGVWHLLSGALPCPVSCAKGRYSVSVADPWGWVALGSSAHPTWLRAPISPAVPVYESCAYSVVFFILAIGVFYL